MLNVNIFFSLDAKSLSQLIMEMLQTVLNKQLKKIPFYHWYISFIIDLSCTVKVEIFTWGIFWIASYQLCKNTTQSLVFNLRIALEVIMFSHMICLIQITKFTPSKFTMHYSICLHNMHFQKSKFSSKFSYKSRNIFSVSTSTPQMTDNVYLYCILLLKFYVAFFPS